MNEWLIRQGVDSPQGGKTETDDGEHDQRRCDDGGRWPRKGHD